MSITEDISSDSHLFGGVSSKGRLRRPSAKILANASPPTAAAAPVSWKQAHLVLQSGVAEVVMNDAEADHFLEPRPAPITVDLWSSKKSVFLPKEPKPPSETTVSSPVLGVSSKDELVLEEKLLVLPEPPDDGGSFESVAGDDLAQSGSTNPTSTSPNEVKRKRGRPFKGQEKPIEERLLIETSKIRRLIDDILRKGPKESSEFCNRLRTIANDLDDVMTLAEDAATERHPPPPPSDQ